MLKASALAILLLLLPATARSQDQPESGRKSGVTAPKPNQSSQTKQQSSVDTRGTEQNPVSVKVISTPETQTETTEERQRRLIHEANEQGLTDYTRVLADATIALCIIAVVQAGMFLWQLGYMRRGLRDAQIAAYAAKDSASAGKASADISKLAMVAGDRAYVHYAGCRWISHRENSAAPVFWRIRPKWINTGNTPTRKLEVWAYYELLDEPLESNFPYPFAIRSSAIPGMLHPKGTIESGWTDVWGSHLDAVKNGTKFFYIWGVARYRDVFPDTGEHVTKFCVAATNVSGDPTLPWDEKTNPVDIAFMSYHRHNCADEDCER